MGKKEFDEAADLIRRSRDFLIACHVRPDGDTLGSALALAGFLRRMDKNVLVVCEDGVPETYTFLPDIASVVTSAPAGHYDVAIIPDCDGLERVGNAVDVVKSAGAIISIDHHNSRPQFGDVRIYDSSASATAEIVTEFLDHLHYELDAGAATCLMTGIVSDTGAFRFRNVTSRTFDAAARLTAAGASPSDIARLVYESRSLESTKLLGVALASLETDETGRLVWASLTLPDFARTGASDADAEGIINHINAIKTAQVALLFREAVDGKVMVSLRSRDSVDVRKIASVFGGGGHAAASGCHLPGPIDEAKRKVIEEALKWMQS